MFSRILWTIIMISAGFTIIKFRRNIYDFTGRIDLFEKYFGNTLNGFTIIAITIFIIAIMYVTGGLDMFVKGSLLKFFGE